MRLLSNKPINLPLEIDNKTPFMLLFLEVPDLPIPKNNNQTYLGLTNCVGFSLSDSQEDF